MRESALALTPRRAMWLHSMSGLPGGGLASSPAFNENHSRKRGNPMQNFQRFAACAALLVVCACGGSNSQAERCTGAAPEASAGPAQSAGKRATVNLGGTAARTTGDVTYAWRLDAPPGSKAALSSSSAAAPSFTTDV